MRTIAGVVCVGLVGCQTTLDPNYALQLESYRLTITSQQNVEIAKAKAEEARYVAMATIAERADAQTKSMALFALALSGRGEVASRPIEVQLPRIPETSEDRALKWASVIVPSVANVALAGFSYALGRTQSNNQASTTQASYAALVAFKPQPFDWSKVPPTTSNVITTTTTTTNDTTIANRDGNVNVGVGAPANQDNSSPIAIVPPVVPIVPVVINRP